MNLDFKIYDFLKLIGSHIKQNEKKNIDFLMYCKSN